jgi:hypothetical protein
VSGNVALKNFLGAAWRLLSPEQDQCLMPALKRAARANSLLHPSPSKADETPSNLEDVLRWQGQAKITEAISIIQKTAPP